MTNQLRRAMSGSLLSRLIETPDLVDRVRAMSGRGFHDLVQRVGVEDAGELLALATTEQIVAALDEDLFTSSRPGERESFDPGRFVTWLEVLLEAGSAVTAQRMTELSEEFVTHALSSLVLVLDHEALLMRMSLGDPATFYADKAIESALTEEIEGYVVIARAERGWDAILSLILALDRDHRSLLGRILDRCAAMAREYIDDLEALTELLTAAESLAEDVEAEREDRRGRQGYVEPRAAKSFLELAAMPGEDRADAVARDPVTRAYFRELEPSTAPAASPGEQPEDGWASAVAALPEGAPSEALADAGEVPPIVSALRGLGLDAPQRFAERMAELAYLANVIVAGASVEGRRLRPPEAADAALATVAVGGALAAREQAPGETAWATADELRAVLARVSADVLFRKACGVLVARRLVSNPPGFVLSHEQGGAALAELSASA